jgi:hypothetical protein
VAGLGVHGCNDGLRRCNDHILGISLESHASCPRVCLSLVARAAAVHDVGLVERRPPSRSSTT